MQNNCANMQNSMGNPIPNSPQSPISSSSGELIYAGFWVRLGAYAIDMIVVFAGLLFVRLVMWIVMSALGDTFLGGNILFHYTLEDIVLYAAQALYFILCTYFTGTTPGKSAMNLRVVSAQENKKLTLLSVVYRETIGRFLSGFIFGVGYIMIGIDKEKRGLHDFLCDTRVIYGKKVKIYPVYQRPVQSYVPPQPPVPPAQPNMPVQRPVPPVPPVESVTPDVPVQPPVESPVEPVATDVPVQPPVEPVQSNIPVPPVDTVNESNDSESYKSNSEE